MVNTFEMSSFSQFDIFTIIIIFSHDGHGELGAM